MKINNKNQFVWTALRICFWSMIGIWIIIVTFTNIEEVTLLSQVWMALILATFTLSIMHLIKYKQKAFAIVALVITSFWLLTVLIGMVIGVAELI
jgi:hypothetical protein